MAKILCCAVVVLMFCCAPAFAATEKFANENELMTWVEHYYLHPDPDSVNKATKDAHELEVLKNRNMPVMIGFYAGLFQSNKKLRQPTADLNYSFPQVDRHAILRALSFSTKNDDPAPLLTEPLDKTPLIIDMLWGYFYATGDEAAVKRIIETLPWSEMKQGDIKNDKDKAMRQQVGASAKRSLTDNAARHQRAMEICKKELPGQPPETKPILQQVISQAGSAQPAAH